MINLILNVTEQLLIPAMHQDNRFNSIAQINQDKFSIAFDII